MLTMFHRNPARVDDGILKVDRKFLTGMQRYAAAIRAPLLTVHPELPADGTTMDLVEVPIRDLGFEVLALDHDAARHAGRVRELVGRSALVYGNSFDSARAARQMGVPSILALELDLPTHLLLTAQKAEGRLRKGVRVFRRLRQFMAGDVPDMRGASEIHCNGYPVYDEAARYNPNRLLYLDSRMGTGDVIAADELERRLAGRAGRPLRLLFSGRYENFKGAADCIRVATACQRRGLDVELHTYGQGSQRDAMLRLARAAPSPERIHVHGAIPYPELVQRARGFDLFVCCHVQSDPSCTYLESFGCGLPIVGYANRMWSRLQQVSGAGYVSPMHDPEAVAADVARLLNDPAGLADLSRRARAFALEHSFEREFARRTDSLNAALEARR